MCLVAKHSGYLRIDSAYCPITSRLSSTTMTAHITPHPQQSEVLTEPAVRFLVALERRFGPVRRELLAARTARQARLDAGELPDFLAETAAVRLGGWSVAPPPADLRDRRVEITGPVERKMMI